MVLLLFLNTYHFTNTFSHAHTKAHTHKHTCMISTQEEWRQPGTGAWLGGAEENGFVRNKSLSRKKMPAHRDLHSFPTRRSSDLVQSAHKRNGDNQAQEPGWEGRKKGFC